VKHLQHLCFACNHGLRLCCAVFVQHFSG